MSVYHGIRITIKDEDLPIQEFYDDLEIATRRAEELVEYFDITRQNKINWLMQFGGLTQEQASEKVKRPEVKIEQVGKSQIFKKFSKSNLDKKSNLVYNIYIKDKKLRNKKLNFLSFNLLNGCEAPQPYKIKNFFKTC